MEFYEKEPTLEAYWRSIILFGRNVASYKFALSKSLIDLSSTQADLITLDQLAEPFAEHICRHLKQTDKQTTSQSSRFLDECRKYNTGEIDRTSLITATSKLGFANVIDAFHNINQAELPTRFFIDERRSTGGIRLTEQFFTLLSDRSSSALYDETEARWRLVETAWSLNLSRTLITVNADMDGDALFTAFKNRRIDITSSKHALNGYQKGRCFYSFKPISIKSGDPLLADVDHFFPNTLNATGEFPNINGVWNLVLSSKACNRGKGGKFAKLPTLRLLERLHQRNEYLITSHHPLRETLIQQTGASEHSRRRFLQHTYNRAKDTLIHTWEPEEQANIIF